MRRFAPPPACSVALLCLVIATLLGSGCARADRQSRVDLCVQHNFAYDVGDDRYERAVRKECARLNKAGDLLQSGRQDVYVTCPPSPEGDRPPCTLAAGMTNDEVSVATNALKASRLTPLLLAGRTADLAVTVATSEGPSEALADSFAVNEGLSLKSGFSNGSLVACSRLSVVVAGETGGGRKARSRDLQRSLVTAIDGECEAGNVMALPTVAKALTENSVIVRALWAGLAGQTTLEVKVFPTSEAAARQAEAWNRDEIDPHMPDHSRAAAVQRQLLHGYVMDARMAPDLDRAFEASLKALRASERK